jgi:hypothetical protein
MMLWLDEYQRYARLVPGMLVVFPIAFTVALLGIPEQAVLSSVLTALSLCGGPLVLAEAVAHLGRAVQQEIWDGWGGSPTVRFLRSSGNEVSAIERDRWRRNVTLITDVPLLPLEREEANPKEAEETIEAAVATLRELTRDTERFPILWTENKSYGFHRNVYGARILGRYVSFSLAIMVFAYILIASIVTGSSQFSWRSAIAIGVNLMLFVGWLAIPSVARVKLAAERYARQLLNAANRLALEGKRGNSADA